VVLDVMIEDDGIGVVVPALDKWWWILWHDGGGIVLLTYLLKPVNHPKSNFQCGWDFGFSNSPKVPPNCSEFVQLPIFYLVNN
jgi:hypothetical protein